MMKRNLSRNPLALAVALASGLASSGLAVQVQAAEETQRATVLQEIVVTAEKREASLQETPIAISAFDSQSLENLGVANLGDITNQVPNFQMTPFPNSRSALVLFIRGVGNNESQTTQDPAVGVYYDGVYVARSVGLAADTADLERIEVLRGPQGVLYGRNTTGGAVNLISAKPTGELGFKQVLGMGDNAYWHGQTQVNLPETAGFSVKLSYDHSEKDGWRKNLGVSGDDFEQYEKNGGRVAVRWQPADKVTVDYSYDVSKISGPQGYYQILEVTPIARPYFLLQGFPAGYVDNLLLPALKASANPHRTGVGIETRPVKNSDTDVSGHSLTASWELDDLTLKSITAYRDLHENIYQNYSANYSTILQAPLQEFLNVDAMVGHNQFSQEFQAIGNAMDNRLKYVGGLYYFSENGNDSEFDTAGAFTVENRYTHSHNTAVAAYGQLTWTPQILDDRMDVTLGLRHTEDTREAEKYSAVYFLAPHKLKKTYHDDSPALTVSYRWTDDLSTYAKATAGYKAGGFNTRSTEKGFQNPFKPEHVTSYELGVKSTWLDNRVRANADVFVNDWKDMQQNFILNPGTPFLTDTFNAGRATTSGFELDLTAIVVEGLQLSVNYAYLNAEFKQVIDQNPTSPTYGWNIGNTYNMPYAPQQSYAVAADYFFPQMDIGQIALHLDYSWRDNTVGTAPPQDGFDLPAYGLWNARATLSEVASGNGGKLKFSVWGKNLTDEEYLMHSVGFGAVNVGWFGEPRSYGVDVTYEYR